MTMQDDHYISVFTPSRTAPETLEHIFVQRKQMLVEAIARVDECLSRDTRHQQLIVGPRGAGKTHFITLLVHRLARQASTQRPTLRVAWMNEDETFTSFLDVLIGLYRALNKRHPDEFPLQRLDTLYASPDTAETALAQAIVDTLQQHQCCCLLVVENLDQLFESIGLQGQQKLRAYLQESRCFTLFATAQKLTRALKDRGEPFFGFFQTDHLQPLNEAEATSLIGRITQLHDDDQQGSEVSAFLQTPHGQARIAALHHLSGGNHRMYIVLSQFISRDSIDALVRPFLKMVDELTPYYQERIRWLPPLQRKIIEVLCADRHTVSVNDIARRVFRSNQSIAAQLKELKDKGYVRANKRGRESLYEVTEPLMRICVEVKNNQQSKPIALLVEFIRAWYDREAIEARLQHAEVSALSKRYLQAAMEASKTPESLVQGFDIEAFTDLLMTIPKKINSSNVAIVIRQLTAVIEFENAPVTLVSVMLILRAIAHSTLSESANEIADYNRVIELDNLPPNIFAWALVNHGVKQHRLGNFATAIANFNRVIKLKGTPIGHLVSAWMHLTESHLHDHDWPQALEAIKSGLSLDTVGITGFDYNTKSILAALFDTTTPTTIHERANQIADLFSAKQPSTAHHITELATGLISHLGILARGDSLPSVDQLESWSNAWSVAAERHPGLIDAVRILKVGVAYLLNNRDEMQLLDLVETDRKILADVLALPD